MLRDSIRTSRGQEMSKVCIISESKNTCLGYIFLEEFLGPENIGLCCRPRGLAISC